MTTPVAPGGEPCPACYDGATMVSTGLVLGGVCRVCDGTKQRPPRISENTGHGAGQGPEQAARARTGPGTPSPVRREPGDFLPTPVETPPCDTCNGSGLVTSYSGDGSAYDMPCPYCTATPTPDPLAALQRENAELREKLEAAETELSGYRHGYSTWTNEDGETEPSARFLRALWSGLRNERQETLKQSLAQQDAELDAKHAKLVEVADKLNTARAEAATVAAQLAELEHKYARLVSLSSDNSRRLVSARDAAEAQLAEARRTIAQQEAAACRRIGRNATLASSLREAEAREAELRGLVERGHRILWRWYAAPPWEAGELPAGQATEEWIKDYSALAAHPVALPREPTPDIPETKEPR